jgi:hypothetical protein
MIFFVLLSPLAAMGFLAAMEWVERWTLAEVGTADLGERRVAARPVQSRSVRATPTGQDTPVPPMPQ